jgi:hypothetical protein
MRYEKVGFILKHLTELHRDRTFRVAVDVNKIVEALMPEKMEYSGTLKPNTSLGISVFARIIERSAHGNLGAAPKAILRSCQGLLGLGPRHRNRSAPGVVDAMDDKGLMLHASRVNEKFCSPLLEYPRVRA